MTDFRYAVETMSLKHFTLLYPDLFKLTSLKSTQAIHQHQNIIADKQEVKVKKDDIVAAPKWRETRCFGQYEKPKHGKFGFQKVFSEMQQTYDNLITDCTKAA